VSLNSRLEINKEEEKRRYVEDATAISTLKIAQIVF
jgi:hypothetical protein